MREIIESKLRALGELEESSQLEKLATEVSEFTGQPVDVHYVGEYDSPGYTVNFYVITWVEGRRAETLPVEIIWC